MPYIKKQAEIIPKVFDHWYIVEGYSFPVKDTRWCRNINTSQFTKNLLSIDGTTEFLDSIKNENITIIRKNDGWQGKVEMCNSFASELDECILMEFDVDEIWNEGVLNQVLNFSENNPMFDAMLFNCNYYVGTNHKLIGENCYGNKKGEWLRLWNIKKPSYWISHEPPRLNTTQKYLSKEFTKNMGWIFDHYAYVTESQLKFKENYYGYQNAVEQWKALQQVKDFPVNLKDYFSWVSDHAQVDYVKQLPHNFD